MFYAVLRRDEDEACELARFILESSILKPDHMDAYGQTALFYAAREGHTRCVQMLVEEFHFDVSHVDHAKQTAVFYAARDGRTDALDFLVRSGADINHVDANGDTPIFYSARDGRCDTIHRMVDLGANCGFRNRSKSYASTIARKMGFKRLANDLDAARKVQMTKPPDTVVEPPTRRATRRSLSRVTSARRKRPSNARVQNDSGDGSDSEQNHETQRDTEESSVKLPRILSSSDHEDVNTRYSQISEEAPTSAESRPDHPPVHGTGKGYPDNRRTSRTAVIRTRKKYVLQCSTNKSEWTVASRQQLEVRKRFGN